MVTANQWYVASNVVSMTSTDTDASAEAFSSWTTLATYGQIWGLWLYKKNETSTTAIALQVPDQVIFVGNKKNVGTAFIFTLTVTTKNYHGNAKDTSVFGTAGVAASNAAILSAPTGGMGQFKGLSTSTPVSKYNEIVCKSV